MSLKSLFSGKLASTAAALLLVASPLVVPASGQDPSGRPTDSAPKNTKRPPRRTSQPVAPQPFTVILTVLTDPPGCTVFINGEARGETNEEGKIQFEKLPLSTYSIEVKKDGYFPGIRSFKAGSESPTLVFKLEVNLDNTVKEFDALIEAGKLVEPESPNAHEIVKTVSSKYPTRPETSRMRGVLSAKLFATVRPLLDRTVTKWRTVSREELAAARETVSLASQLKPEDTRIQAHLAYLKGLILVRDWQAGPPQGQPAGAESKPSAEQVSENAEGEASGLPGARAWLEKALQLDDAWAAARYHLGLIMLNQGDAANAEAAFIKVTQAEPRWVVGHIGLGSAYYVGGKIKESIDAYRRALELESGNAAALAGLGLARAAKGDTREGIKEINRAMELDPTSGLPHLYLGQIYSQSKKRSEITRAIEELKKAIQKNANNADFQNEKAEQLIADLQKPKRK